MAHAVRRLGVRVARSSAAAQMGSAPAARGAAPAAVALPELGFSRILNDEASAAASAAAAGLAAAAAVLAAMGAASSEAPTECFAEPGGIPNSSSGAPGGDPGAIMSPIEVRQYLARGLASAREQAQQRGPRVRIGKNELDYHISFDVPPGADWLAVVTAFVTAVQAGGLNIELHSASAGKPAGPGGAVTWNMPGGGPEPGSANPAPGAGARAGAGAGAGTGPGAEVPGASWARGEAPKGPSLSFLLGNGKGSVLLRGDPPVAPGVRALGAATIIGGPGVGLAPQTLSVYKEEG